MRTASLLALATIGAASLSVARPVEGPTRPQQDEALQPTAPLASNLTSTEQAEIAYAAFSDVLARHPVTTAVPYCLNIRGRGPLQDGISALVLGRLAEAGYVGLSDEACGCTFGATTFSADLPTIRPATGDATITVLQSRCDPDTVNRPGFSGDSNS